eukprot:c1865_g1_i1.p1 GENE.c1865_g1_i1~~c1865_g1_i1.p1  ORF type:complete len:235 (-),score=49.08 c1865_g1_i1:19-723(-)
MAKIVLYLDCISPYTYLAWPVLLRYRPIWNFELVLKPFFLGGVMVSTGNKPPATLPQKAKFMNHDLVRNADMFDIPLLQAPSNFFSEVARKIILVQRAIVALQVLGLSQNLVEQSVSELMAAVHQDKSLRTPTNSLDVNEELVAGSLRRAGLDDATIQKVLEKAQSQEVKDQLTQNTTEAVEFGAFGSPTMIVHGGKAPFEKPFMVFGSDRFEQIAHCLGKPWLGHQPKTTSRL